MEEEGEDHRRGPLVLCLFGGEEYCCVEDPFGLDSHQQALTCGRTTRTTPGLALDLLGGRGADAFRCSTMILYKLFPL
jgi:hypothetical protein